MLSASNGRKVGICCPGGGAAGAVQAGMLWACQKWIPKVHAVCGVSVGALNATLFAQGDTLRLSQIWSGIRKKDVYSRWKLFLPGLWSNSYFSTRPLEKLIEEVVDLAALRGRPTQLLVQACDRDSGHPVLATQHDADFKRVLLASASIPVLFPQVEARGKWLVDGGVADNSPLTPLVNVGCDQIYVLHCRPAKEPRTAGAHSRLEMLAKLPSLFFAANQDTDRLRVQWLNEKFATTGTGKHIDVVDIYPARNDVGMLEFDAEKASQGLHEGHKAAERVLRPSVTAQ